MEREERQFNSTFELIDGDDECEHDLVFKFFVRMGEMMEVSQCRACKEIVVKVESPMDIPKL